MAPVLSEGCEAGGLFAYLNTNKQSVVLDAGRLDRLIGTADAVIEDRTTDRSAQHPDVVFCSITPFGSGVPAEFDTAKSINAVARLLAADTHYVALCHWNANVDNAWFWRDGPDGRGALRCGLMDWGCVGQMNLGMALWGALSGAETRLRKDHFDELLHLLVREFQRCGGPPLNPDRLRRHTALYAATMGVAWLLDAPALLLSRFGEALPGSRDDPRIRDDESVHAPLQMLTNLLTLWERYRIGDLLNDALGEPGVC